MDMRYFGIMDQVDQGNFKIQWHPGTKNLADYPSKHHLQNIHNYLRKYYMHEEILLDIYINIWSPVYCEGVLEPLTKYNYMVPWPIISPRGEA